MCEKLNHLLFSFDVCYPLNEVAKTCFGFWLNITVWHFGKLVYQVSPLSCLPRHLWCVFRVTDSFAYPGYSHAELIATCRWCLVEKVAFWHLDVIFLLTVLLIVILYVNTWRLLLKRSQWSDYFTFDSFQNVNIKVWKGISFPLNT